MALQPAPPGVSQGLIGNGIPAEALVSASGTGFWEKRLLLLRPQSRVDFSVKQASPLWYPGLENPPSTSNVEPKGNTTCYCCCLVPWAEPSLQSSSPPHPNRTETDEDKTS